MSALSFDRMSGEELVLRGYVDLIPGRLAEIDQDTGLVYAVQSARPRSPVKIGYCHAWGLDDRLKGLQTGNPEPLRVLARSSGYLSHEQRSHKALAADRLTGEWFRWSPAVAAFIKRLRTHGCEYAIAAAKIAKEA